MSACRCSAAVPVRGCGRVRGCILRPARKVSPREASSEIASGQYSLQCSKAVMARSSCCMSLVPMYSVAFWELITPHALACLYVFPFSVLRNDNKAIIGNNIMACTQSRLKRGGHWLPKATTLQSAALLLIIPYWHALSVERKHNIPTIISSIP